MHEPAILQGARRVRYLKLIGLFKISKGVLLLLVGVSLLFLNARTRWMHALSDWTADEILLEHSKPIGFLLHRLQTVLADGALRATGLLALSLLVTNRWFPAFKRPRASSGATTGAVGPAAKARLLMTVAAINMSL